MVDAFLLVEISMAWFRFMSFLRPILVGIEWVLKLDQIKHLKKILIPRFIEYRIPNQNVLINNFSEKDERILSNSATDSSFIYVFSPKGESFNVDLNYLKGEQIIYKWFNPRNGRIEFQDSIKQGTEMKKFLPPTKGDIFSANDWVLIIEQELKGDSTQ